MTLASWLMCQRFKFCMLYGIKTALFQMRANGGGRRTVGHAKASRGLTSKSNRRRGTSNSNAIIDRVRSLELSAQSLRFLCLVCLRTVSSRVLRFHSDARSSILAHLHAKSRHEAQSLITRTLRSLLFSSRGTTEVTNVMPLVSLELDRLLTLEFYSYISTVHSTWPNCFGALGTNSRSLQ